MTAMQKCVGFACETLDLQFLQGSESVVLHQDVSRNVLVVTFSAARADLTVARGFLGCENLEPGEMDSLQKTTRQILWTACGESRPLFDCVRRKVVACLSFFKFCITQSF